MMNQKIDKLLKNQGGNYIFPFFWQHGEDEPTLRRYMKAIQEANIGAVCVESRPHPDFVGPKWWQDMDVILDEARKRDMKVWILDDSHFPTGYANGALEDAPAELARRNVACQIIDCSQKARIVLGQKMLTGLPPEKMTPFKALGLLFGGNKTKKHYDDKLLGVIAVRFDKGKAETRDLTGLVNKGTLE